MRPYDATLALDFFGMPTDLKGELLAGFEGFMTSMQLDDYCANSKYYTYSLGWAATTLLLVATHLLSSHPHLTSHLLTTEYESFTDHFWR